MALTVWKYVWPVLEPEVTIDMPQGAEVLHVGAQNEQLCLWARLDPNAPPAPRTFVLCGTGHEAPDCRHIGTVLLHNGTLVLHVFERGVP